MSSEKSAEELWAGFALDPRTPAHVDLRASDADRARVSEVLADAFADGRLDRAELDERSDALAATRTLGELPPLVRDLLAPGTTSAPGAPATTPTGALDLTTASEADLQARAEQEWESQRRGAIFAFLGPTIICWVVWLAIEVGQPGSFPSTFPWPLIVTAATGFHAARRLSSRREIVDDELRRLHRKRATALGLPTPVHDRDPDEDGDEERR